MNYTFKLLSSYQKQSCFFPLTKLQFSFQCIISTKFLWDDGWMWLTAPANDTAMPKNQTKPSSDTCDRQAADLLICTGAACVYSRRPAPPARAHVHLDKCLWWQPISLVCCLAIQKQFLSPCLPEGRRPNFHAPFQSTENWKEVNDSPVECRATLKIAPTYFSQGILWDCTTF